MMNEFRVGDLVEFTPKELYGHGMLRAGLTGVIVVISPGKPFPIGVAWDEDIGGHDLGEKCEYGHGWWINAEDIVPYSEKKFEPASESELMQFLFDK